MTASSQLSRDEQIAAAITANRMERVDGCEWATPAVRDVLAEFAADLRPSIPLSAVFDRIRRAVEADRAGVDTPARLQLVS
ncbi:hypothetical protein [Nocardioides sp. AN3]